jgi:hypothetical protein
MGGAGDTGRAGVGEEGAGTRASIIGLGGGTGGIATGTRVSITGLDGGIGGFAMTLRGTLLRTLTTCFFVFSMMRDFAFASAETPKLGWLKSGADHPSTSATATTGVYFVRMRTALPMVVAPSIRLVTGSDLLVFTTT